LENSSTLAGGGLYITADGTPSAGAIFIQNTTVDGNNSQLGGGFYISSTGNIYLNNSLFRSNQSNVSSGPGGGGGVYMIGKNTYVSGNRFLLNSTGGFGGGIHIRFSPGITGQINFTHNTLWKNSGSFGGGTFIYGDNSSSIKVVNNIMFNNTASAGSNDGDDLFIDGNQDNTGSDDSYVILQNNILGLNSNFTTGDSEDLNIQDVSSYTQSGNKSEEPKLANPDAGDLHILSDSPAVDAGIAPPYSVSPDFDGDTRPISSYDIGADEYNPSPSTSFSLTVSISGSGSVSSTPPGISCGTDCNETYQEGFIITLSSSPDSGYSFSFWQGDCSSCGNNTDCTIIMTADKSCTAVFALAGGGGGGGGGGAGGGAAAGGGGGGGCGGGSCSVAGASQSVLMLLVPLALIIRRFLRRYHGSL